VKTLVSVLLALASTAALAQGYPAKPITLIIPFSAGGDSDLSGRNVAVHAQVLNNQPLSRSTAPAHRRDRHHG
jgi:tripartite-type tricarboxylate transporter receptor subunit TctC